MYFPAPKYSLEWLMREANAGSDFDTLYFWGHSNDTAMVNKSCFSQWSPHPFQSNRLIYPTAEHWMMSCKALFFGDRSINEQVLASGDPKIAKQLGRAVSNYSEVEWQRIRYQIVLNGNFQKFFQNETLKDFILSTENRLIVEASPNDTVWGIGLTEAQAQETDVTLWPGLNLLGFALMHVRDLILQLSGISELPHLLPPWIKYQDIESSDLFWRMGSGESYLTDFQKQFMHLSLEQKILYALVQPTPVDWLGFYDGYFA